jgi:hypothetical protein
MERLGVSARVHSIPRRLLKSRGGSAAASKFASLPLDLGLTVFRYFSAIVSFFLFLSPAFTTRGATNETTVLVVVGAPGDAEFGSNFVHQADLWTRACTQAGCRQTTFGLDADGSTNDYDRLKLTLAEEPKEGLGQLWLVLVGHGTFDGKEARFNLRGPDVSATELALWLQPFQRPVAVVNTASASAPFLNKLSGTNRVLITATRSGYEQNFTRFGQFFAEAIANPEADLDKDGQVSLLEAFLTASRRVAEFYKVEGRLATEHALLDDNGDGLGTPADWFRGLRATKGPQENAPLDGLLAGQFHLVPSDTERGFTMEQRAQRDQLERAILLHRDKKGPLGDDEYYRQLEQLLVPLAQFYSSNSNAK